jgi:hypothetical protein
VRAIAYLCRFKLLESLWWRWVDIVGVGGSIPPAPTKKIRGLRRFLRARQGNRPASRCQNMPGTSPGSPANLGNRWAVLAQAIDQEHQAAQRAAQTFLKQAIECGRLLIEAKAALPHGAWLPWLEANVSFGARQAQKYIRLADHADALPNTNSGSHLSINEALDVLRGEDALRVMHSSETPEWYTPAPIVERVVATLGEIDLDPSWHPQSAVQAKTAYTLDDDGLAQHWAGRVYLNPPYGRAIDAWIAALVAGYEAGAVSEAVALVPARVDTEWFRRLDPFPRCFVYGRLTFANAEHPAPFPSAAVYLGRRLDRFVTAFGAIGSIFVRLAGS